MSFLPNKSVHLVLTKPASGGGPTRDAEGTGAIAATTGATIATGAACMGRYWYAFPDACGDVEKGNPPGDENMGGGGAWECGAWGGGASGDNGAETLANRNDANRKNDKDLETSII
jgi:hypothetical protein